MSGSQGQRNLRGVGIVQDPRNQERRISTRKSEETHFQSYIQGA